MLHHRRQAKPGHDHEARNPEVGANPSPQRVSRLLAVTQGESPAKERQQSSVQAQLKQSEISVPVHEHSEGAVALVPQPG